MPPSPGVGSSVTFLRQMTLWPELDRTGPRGFPLCQACNSEGIGPGTPWCYRCWSPERDPEGAASARALGLLPTPSPSPVSSHPARDTALVSTPRTGLDSQHRPGGQHR